MTYSEVVRENQKLRWENAILKNQMDDTNAEKERADKAEALARELVEALEKSLVNVAWELAEQEHLLNLAKEVLGDA